MNKFILIALFVITSCAENALFDDMVFLGSAPNGAKIEYEKCVEENKFVLSEIVISPDTVVKGQKMSVTGTGTALVDLSLKKVHMVVKLGSATLATEDKAIEKTVVAGEATSFEYSGTVPKILFSGNYEITATLLTTSGETVSCIKAKFSI